MKTKYAIHIVGDAFHNITDSKAIFTTTQFISNHSKIKPTDIYIGQGVSLTKYENIKNIIINNNDQHPLIHSTFDDYVKCDKELTHKHKIENILISTPTTINKDKYKSVLMIDDDCIELSDHVTGQHLQFMLLIEAARQMANAVTQKFYSSSFHIYLLNKLEANFEGFIYPFHTVLECTLLNKDLKIDGNGRMSMTINFIQKNKIPSSISFQYTVMEKNFVRKLEELGIEKHLH